MSEYNFYLVGLLGSHFKDNESLQLFEFNALKQVCEAVANDDLPIEEIKPFLEKVYFNELNKHLTANKQ